MAPTSVSAFPVSAVTQFLERVEQLNARYRAGQMHVRVPEAMRDGVSHARRAGELLLHVKAKLMYGQFMPWVERHCEFSHRTATMYMRIASEWDRITADWQSIANLGIAALDARLAVEGGSELSSAAETDEANHERVEAEIAVTAQESSGRSRCMLSGWSNERGFDGQS